VRKTLVLYPKNGLVEEEKERAGKKSQEKGRVTSSGPGPYHKAAENEHFLVKNHTKRGMKPYECLKKEPRGE